MSGYARDKRIRIEAPTTVKNDIGEQIPGWTLFAVQWANVFDVGGREPVAAAALQNVVTTRMETAWREGLAANMRVLLGADVYNIEAVLGQNRVDSVLLCRRLAQ